MRDLFEKMRVEKEQLFNRTREAIGVIKDSERITDKDQHEQVHAVARRTSHDMDTVLDFYLRQAERDTFIGQNFEELDDGRFRVTTYHTEKECQ